MVRFAILAAALASALVGAFFYSAADTTTSDATAGESPAALVVETPDYVDPACLWPVLDSGFNPDALPAPTVVPLQGCAPAIATLTQDDGWARLSVEESGEDVSRRYTGTRIVQTMHDGTIALEAYDNWGGSGVFSSLVTGKLSASGDGLSDVQAYGFGDRCNGGLAGTRVAEDGRIHPTANMTPWDILMTPFKGMNYDDQIAAAKARYGVAYLEAPSCAICCSSVTQEYIVDVDAGTMSEAGLRYTPQAGGRLSDNPIAVCLDEAVKQIPGTDGLVTVSEAGPLETAIAACAAAARTE